MKFITLFWLSVVLLMGARLLEGGIPATMPSATAPAPSGVAAGSASPSVAEDDFPPLVLLLLLVAIVIFLFLAVLVIVGGAVAAAVMSILLLCGILTSSIVIGLIRRTRGSAVRAFVIQAGAAIGIPCGIVAFWLANRWGYYGLKLPSVHLRPGERGGTRPAYQQGRCEADSPGRRPIFDAAASGVGATPQRR